MGIESNKTDSDYRLIILEIKYNPDYDLVSRGK
jgi:hypothetical protein